MSTSHGTRRLQQVIDQLGPRAPQPWETAVDVAIGAAATTAHQPLRLAFIGCGQICNAHLNALNAIASEQIQVTVCIDAVLSRAEEMATQVARTSAGHGAKPTVHASLADAVADSKTCFEAVSIMLPHHLHKALTLESFAAGKHVMLEKPMAPNLEDAAEILAAAAKWRKRSGLTFMMAENSQACSAPDNNWLLLLANFDKC